MARKPKSPNTFMMVKIAKFQHCLLVKKLLEDGGSVPLQPKLYNYNSKGESILFFQLGSQPKPL